jgi:tetratricopeptide (TPR) repeat protein
VAGEVPILHGQLLAESPSYFQGIFVSLEEVINRTEVHRVDVGHEGNFELRGVPTGDYLLRVTNVQGQTLYQQYVTVQEHMRELTVRLPESERRPSAPGTVSLMQLSHPPDKKAVQAFTAAVRLSSSGKYGEAAAELEKAIRISPEFAGAYTNLAVQQIRMNRFEDAAASSEHAIQIAGPDPINLCNLAFAQYQLQRYDDAMANARAALRLDSGYLQAHLVLGALLARDPAARAEAIRHLELAAEKFPSARVNLDRLRAAQ